MKFVIEKLVDEVDRGCDRRRIIMWMSKPVDESNCKICLKCKLSFLGCAGTAQVECKHFQEVEFLIKDSHQQFKHCESLSSLDFVSWICNRTLFPQTDNDEWFQNTLKSIISACLRLFVRLFYDFHSGALWMLFSFTLFLHSSGLWGFFFVVWIHKSISLQCALFIRYLFRFLCDSCSHASHAPHWNIIKFITSQLNRLPSISLSLFDFNTFSRLLVSC